MCPPKGPANPLAPRAFDGVHQTVRIVISGVEAKPLLEAVIDVGRIHHGADAEIPEVERRTQVTPVIYFGVDRIAAHPLTHYRSVIGNSQSPGRIQTEVKIADEVGALS